MIKLDVTKINFLIITKGVVVMMKIMIIAMIFLTKSCSKEVSRNKSSSKSIITPPPELSPSSGNAEASTPISELPSTLLPPGEKIVVEQELLNPDPQFTGDLQSQIDSYRELSERQIDKYAVLNNRISYLLTQLYNLAGGGCMLDQTIDMLKVYSTADTLDPKVLDDESTSEKYFNLNFSKKLTITLGDKLKFDIDDIAKFFESSGTQSTNGNLTVNLSNQDIKIRDIQHVLIKRDGFSISTEQKRKIYTSDDALRGSGSGEAFTITTYTHTETHRYALRGLKIVAVVNRRDLIVYQLDDLNSPFYFPRGHFSDPSLVYSEHYRNLSKIVDCSI